jgi:Domain of unknown function (DUF4129)
MSTEPDTTGARSRLKPDYRDFFDAPWVGGLFRPILIALVAASLVAGPVALLRVMGTTWHLGYVLPCALLAALEGVYSTLRLGRPTWRDRRGLVFRLGEIILLLVLFRIAVWAFSAGWPSLDDLKLWLRQPVAFLDNQFFFFGIWVVMAWGLAIGITGDFLDLALQPDEIAAHDIHGWGESRSEVRVGRATARGDILGRFAARWMVGGVVLVLFASLSQVDVGLTERGTIQVGLNGFGLSAELVIALLCYFLAGLLLISQGRLAVLRGRWFNQDVDVQPIVLRRWQTNSLLAVLLVGLIAALLPMGTTSWLSMAIGALIALFMRLMYLLFFVLMLILSVLLWPLRFLFQSRTESPVEQVQPLAIPTQAETVSRLPDWLGGAVLWIIIALVIAYFGLTYLNAHGLLKGRPAHWLMRLRYWWRARWARASAAIHAAANALGQRIQLPRARGPAGIGAPSVRVSSLTPRDRVRYFYLRMVRRAAERGLVRRPHETPSEFARQLEGQWPDAEDDVEALTTAFLAARYDHRPIPPAAAQGAQAVWRRVMRALRGKVPAEHGNHEPPPNSNAGG